MTRKQATVRLLLALVGFSLLLVGRVLNSRPAGWVAVLILVGMWVWTALVLKPQRSSN